jgi:hypothetical protein
VQCCSLVGVCCQAWPVTAATAACVVGQIADAPALAVPCCALPYCSTLRAWVLPWLAEAMRWQFGGVAAVLVVCQAVVDLVKCCSLYLRCKPMRLPQAGKGPTFIACLTPCGGVVAHANHVVGLTFEMCTGIVVIQQGCVTLKSCTAPLHATAHWARTQRYK